MDSRTDKERLKTNTPLTATLLMAASIRTPDLIKCLAPAYSTGQRHSLELHSDNYWARLTHPKDHHADMDPHDKPKYGGYTAQNI